MKMASDNCKSDYEKVFISSKIKFKFLQGSFNFNFKKKIGRGRLNDILKVLVKLWFLFIMKSGQMG